MTQDAGEMRTTGHVPGSVSVFFEPRAIALVGISGRADSFTARALQYLQASGFRGPLYPVNPKYKSFSNLPCYPSLESIGEPVDLVLCMLPAHSVLDVVSEAGSIGARGVSVFAAGFSETGPEGRDLEERLISTARKAGVRVLGPNCQGTANFCNGAMASFQRALEYLPAGAGKVAYLGQSGAVGGSLLNLAQERGLGLSLWASTGNQADVSVLDLAEYAINHEPTRVLALYMEDVGDGWRIQRVFRSAREKGKRVVVLRSGRSPAGRQAAQSHTGALLQGAASAFDLIANREGALIAEDIDEMLDVTAALVRLPPARGERLGVITTSGAAGSLVADLCDEYELKFAELSNKTQAAMQELLPAFASTQNPIDVTYQFFSSVAPFINANLDSPFSRLVQALADSNDADIIVLILTIVTEPLDAALARDVAELSSRLKVPVILIWLAGQALTEHGRQKLIEGGVPVFGSVKRALRAAAALVQAGRAIATPVESHPVEIIALRETARQLATTDVPAWPLLDVLDIPYPETVLAQDVDEVALLAHRFDRPVVLKIESSDIPHKTDVDGIRLNVDPSRAESEAAAMLERVRDHHPHADIKGILVQATIPQGIDMLVSATWLEPAYPPLITVGVGGVMTEIYGDTISVVAPSSPQEIRSHMRRLRAIALLEGYRGRKPIDLQAIADVAARLGQAVELMKGQIREFEINPLVAYPQGVVALDVLVSLDLERLGKATVTTKVDRNP